MRIIEKSCQVVICFMTLMFYHSHSSPLSFFNSTHDGFYLKFYYQEGSFYSFRPYDLEEAIMGYCEYIPPCEGYMTKEIEVLVPRKFLTGNETTGTYSRHVVIRKKFFYHCERYNFDIKNQADQTRYNIEQDILDGVTTFQIYYNEDHNLDVRPKRH